MEIKKSELKKLIKEILLKEAKYDITVHDEIRDFYSYDRLGYIGLNAIATHLHELGYNDKDILMYLGSKLVRWFYDQADTQIENEIKKIFASKNSKDKIAKDMASMKKELIKDRK